MQSVEVIHKSTSANAVRFKARLTRAERQVLGILTESSQCMTVLQLQTRTGMPAADIRRILELLSQRGLAARLNTVIDSWVCRAPLHVLGGRARTVPAPPSVA